MKIKVNRLRALTKGSFSYSKQTKANSNEVVVMSEARAPDVKEQVKQDYLEGMKYRDLADKHNVSLNTIKSWIKRYNWSEEKKEKSVPKNKKGAPLNNIKNRSNEPMVQEVEEVLNNSELTEKQRLFCIYYPKCFNATKAAIKAGYSKDTAGVIGYQLLQKTSIRSEIEKIKQNKLNRAMLSEADIFQKYIDIAFMDMSDFMEFGQKEVPMLNPISGEQLIDEDGKTLTYTVDYAHFKDSSVIDGTLISEVSKGKDGAKIKLQDKMKALQWLSDRMQLLPIETQQKLKYEEEKVQMAREKLKVDIEKSNGNKNTSSNTVQIVDDIDD